MFGKKWFYITGLAQLPPDIFILIEIKGYQKKSISLQFIDNLLVHLDELFKHKTVYVIGIFLS